MAKPIDIRHFFRRAPHAWLRRYFDRKRLLADFDWSGTTKRNVDPLVRRWSDLESDVRSQTIKDFQSIQVLATPAGKVQFIDEAPYHGVREEVAAKMLELGDFYACAFWVLLEHPECWDGALRYAIADGKSKRYWRKRINLPKLGRRPTDDDADRLAAALSQYFKTTQGRGSSCVVHPYRRGIDGKREYFFAYPEDHQHTPLVFDAGALVAQPHNPAFEVIFVHDDAQQTLSIWYDGNMNQIRELQVIFANIVLNKHIVRDSPKDDRAYDLKQFLDPDFVFKPASVLGIEKVEVRKIRVRISGKEGRALIIDLNNETPSHVLYQDLAAWADVPSNQLQVTLVGLRVTFDILPKETAKRTRSFQITTPNSCNLKIDDFSPLIERLLTDHGIEPRHLERNLDVAGS